MHSDEGQKRSEAVALAGQLIEVPDATVDDYLLEPEALRLVHAFDGVRTFDDCGQKDTFLVAREKATGKIVAFEYATSPFDVWQARVPDADGGIAELEARKLDLHVVKKHVAVAVTVGADLRASIVDTGLDDDLLPMLDDALEGHAELSDLHPGARLRILALEDRVDGAFARYEELEAVEYIPAAFDPKPLRVYFFAKEPTTTWLARSAKQHDTAKTPSFFYDAKGHQPITGSAFAASTAAVFRATLASSSPPAVIATSMLEGCSP